jgi:hypothetical protein
MRTSGIVECDVSVDCDRYSGTREALIAAGAAKPEWFADVGKRRWHRTDRFNRSFKGLESGRVDLLDHSNGTFTVYIRCTPEERAQRREECRLFAQWTPGTDTTQGPEMAAFERAREDYAYTKLLVRCLGKYRVRMMGRTA